MGAFVKFVVKVRVELAPGQEGENENTGVTLTILAVGVIVYWNDWTPVTKVATSNLHGFMLAVKVAVEGVTVLY